LSLVRFVCELSVYEIVKRSALDIYVKSKTPKDYFNQ